MAEQLQNMFHLVEQEMEAYNRTFESYMMTDNPLLHSILTNMSEHRGKGMRPLITILSAKLFGNVQEITYHLAAAYELFHNATLIHDDIIDESAPRLHKEHSQQRHEPGHIAALHGCRTQEVADAHQDPAERQARHRKHDRFAEFLQELHRTSSFISSFTRHTCHDLFLRPDCLCCAFILSV